MFELWPWAFVFAFCWLAVRYVLLYRQAYRVIAAAGRLYYAAHWTPDRRIPAGEGEVFPEALWGDLRNALGLEPGASTNVLGPPRA